MPLLLNQLNMLVSELWDSNHIKYIGLQHSHNEKAMSLYAEKAKDMLLEADILIATHAPARMLVVFKMWLCETMPMPILTDKVFAAAVQRLGYLKPATREVTLWIELLNPYVISLQVNSQKDVSAGMLKCLGARQYGILGSQQEKTGAKFLWTYFESTALVNKWTKDNLSKRWNSDSKATGEVFVFKSHYNLECADEDHILLLFYTGNVTLYPTFCLYPPCQSDRSKAIS
ncbi:hypothetical protein EW026_g4708 [Hermanssonia centrifuga]|uniref:Uncharacterized protein n=1 Tax=Hermanssonia centrifuga TaxID=98765 RepID=A0A4S4KI25_9APHY|nr:hypothetical protein EW026_g4708 [Hermanssonia centrifuga]